VDNNLEEVYINIKLPVILGRDVLNFRAVKLAAAKSDLVRIVGQKSMHGLEAILALGINEPSIPHFAPLLVMLPEMASSFGKNGFTVDVVSPLRKHCVVIWGRSVSRRIHHHQLREKEGLRFCRDVQWWQRPTFFP